MEQNGINFPVASSGISANTSVWFSIVEISHVEEAFVVYSLRKHSSETFSGE